MSHGGGFGSRKKGLERPIPTEGEGCALLESAIKINQRQEGIELAP